MGFFKQKQNEKHYIRKISPYLYLFCDQSLCLITILTVLYKKNSDWTTQFLSPISLFLVNRHFHCIVITVEVGKIYCCWPIHEQRLKVSKSIFIKFPTVMAEKTVHPCTTVRQCTKWCLYAYGRRRKQSLKLIDQFKIPW